MTEYEENVRADRIEELEAENADIRVKLAKAVDALERIDALNEGGVGCASLARTTLNELTGGKDE